MNIVAPILNTYAKLGNLSPLSTESTPNYAYGYLSNPIHAYSLYATRARYYDYYYGDWIYHEPPIATPASKMKLLVVIEDYASGVIIGGGGVGRKKCIGLKLNTSAGAQYYTITIDKYTGEIVAAPCSSVYITQRGFMNCLRSTGHYYSTRQSRMWYFYVDIFKALTDGVNITNIEVHVGSDPEWNSYYSYLEYNDFQLSDVLTGYFPSDYNWWGDISTKYSANQAFTYSPFLTGYDSVPTGQHVEYVPRYLAADSNASIYKARCSTPHVHYTAMTCSTFPAESKIATISLSSHATNKNIVSVT